MSMNPASVANLNRGGRKPGQTNLATRQKQALATAAALALAGQLDDAAVNTMTPLAVLMAIMRASFASGDLQTARIAAEAAAPFVHSRKSTTQDDPGIPAALMPDPEPTNDEPGPENPIY